MVRRISYYHACILVEVDILLKQTIIYLRKCCEIHMDVEISIIQRKKINNKILGSMNRKYLFKEELCFGK